jgi:hypothetical protein
VVSRTSKSGVPSRAGTPRNAVARSSDLFNAHAHAHARTHVSGLAEISVPSRATIAITLTSEPSKIPTAIRLRRALKTLLRSFAFRCIDINQIGIAQASEGAPPTITPPEPPTRQTGGDCEATQ